MDGLRATRLRRPPTGIHLTGDTNGHAAREAFIVFVADGNEAPTHRRYGRSGGRPYLGLAIGNPIRETAIPPEEPSSPDVGPTRRWYGTVERGKPTILSVRTRFPPTGISGQPGRTTEPSATRGQPPVAIGIRGKFRAEILRTRRHASEPGISIPLWPHDRKAASYVASVTGVANRFSSPVTGALMGSDEYRAR